MGVQYSAIAIFCIYFYQRDPAALQRRMLTREKLGAQRILIALWRILGGTALVLAAMDHRLGWSRTLLKPVPLWLEILSLLLILGAHFLTFEVIKANRFAASIIQVETGQSVSASGPYGIVRHPMYVGFAVMGTFTPLALGSFVALPVNLLVIPIIIFRLLNEESFLRRDLNGYDDYCRQTRHRLIPCIW